MILTLRLAWRNLWRHSRRTWLTALAMIFSNVLLVFMISLQLGSYDLMINNTLQAFSGHIQVQHEGYNEDPKMRRSIPAIADLADTLRADLPGADVAARAMAFALVSSEERSFGIQVVGVQPERESRVSTLPGLVSQGRYLHEAGVPEAVIGSVMARNLKVSVGDELTLLGSGRDGSFAAGVVTIAGIFDSGMPDIDRGMAQLPLGYFQETFAMEDQGHAVVIAVNELSAVPGTLDPVRRNIAGRPLEALDWEALHPGLKQAIQADFSSAWFMYTVLVILVAFSVMNTQLMSVLERTREFGVIMSLGVRPRRLSSLVMLETALMSMIGLLIGIALGAAVALYFNQTGFSYPGMDEIADRFNLPDQVYPSVSFLALMLGPAVVFVFSMAAALYPALRLFRLQPVEAMRAA